MEREKFVNILEKINIVLTLIALLLAIALLLNLIFRTGNVYDINKDGSVDSVDLLLLRQYLIEN